MNRRSVRMLLGIGAGASVFAVGVLGGVVFERTWYEPRRAAMLEGVETTIRAHEAWLKAREPGGLPEAPRLNRPPRTSR